jgi:hypothetical protein
MTEPATKPIVPSLIGLALWVIDQTGEGQTTNELKPQDL